jgi:hypothetical protein
MIRARNSSCNYQCPKSWSKKSRRYWKYKLKQFYYRSAYYCNWARGDRVVPAPHWEKFLRMALSEAYKTTFLRWGTWGNSTSTRHMTEYLLHEAHEGRPPPRGKARVSGLVYPRPHEPQLVRVKLYQVPFSLTEVPEADFFFADAQLQKNPNPRWGSPLTSKKTQILGGGAPSPPIKPEYWVGEEPTPAKTKILGGVGGSCLRRSMLGF